MQEASHMVITKGVAIVKVKEKQVEVGKDGRALERFGIHP
jgi:hypothetical protein